MDALRTNARGVSLMESMVALLIFLIISVGWISVEANLAKTSGQTHVISQAVFVGQSQIDNLRAIDFEELASSQATTYYDASGLPSTADAEGLVFGIDWTVTTPDDNPSLRNVLVSVTWNLDTEIQDTLQLYLTRAE